jgi:hypothetical protein
MWRFVFVVTVVPPTMASARVQWGDFKLDSNRRHTIVSNGSTKYGDSKCCTVRHRHGCNNQVSKQHSPTAARRDDQVIIAR